MKEWLPLNKLLLTQVRHHFNNILKKELQKVK